MKVAVNVLIIVGIIVIGIGGHYWRTAMLDRVVVLEKKIAAATDRMDATDKAITEKFDMVDDALLKVERGDPIRVDVIPSPDNVWVQIDDDGNRQVLTTEEVAAQVEQSLKDKGIQ